MELSASDATLALNYERLVELAGDVTPSELATSLGTTEVTVWRLRGRRSAPSAPFIARVLLAFPGVPFEELFLVVDA